MTVATTNSRRIVDGNGVSQTFSTDFEFFDADDLRVTYVERNSALEIVDSTVLSLTTDYTVSGGDGLTGEVTLLAITPGSNDQIILERFEQATQDLDLVENDPLPAQAIEDALDRLTYLVQQANTLAAGTVDRTIRLPIGDPLGAFNPLPAPSQRAGKFVTFTSTGALALANPDVEVVQRTFDTRTDAETATIDAGVTTITVNRYSSAVDGGGGTFVAVPSEPNHAGKLQSAGGQWWELVSSYPDPMQFGAVADGTTNDLDAIDACIDYVVKTFSGDGFAVVDLRGRYYAVDGPIEIGTQGLHFMNAKLIALPSSNWETFNAVLQVKTGYNVIASNLYIDADDNAYNCWLHTQEGFIRLRDVRVQGFINNGYDFRASIDAQSCFSRKYRSDDPRLNNPSTRTGRGFSFSEEATDSQLWGCQSSYVEYPFYVGRDQHHIRFIGCHPYNAQPNGDPWEDSYGYYIDGGYEITIVGDYTDLGGIYYKIYDDGFPTVYMTIASGSALGSALAEYEAWVVLDTAKPNTDLSQFHMYGNKWRSNEPLISLRTSGSGSWAFDEAIVEDAARNAMFFGSRQEIVGTDGAVAQIVRNAGDDDYSLTRYKNPASSTNQAVEFGSFQDKGIVRVNGVAKFRVNEVGLELETVFSSDLTGDPPNITAPTGTLVYVPNGAGGRTLAVSVGSTWEYADGTPV